MTYWKLDEGECCDVLRSCPSDYYDAVLTDPPYGLRFMGKRWDYELPSVEFWTELLRVMKPGAPLLAFGGTRTFHRLVCGIEDAGFEIRDALFWCYATGFPKSLNISKAIDKSLGVEPVVTGAIGATVCEFLARGEPCQGHGDSGKSQSGQTIHAQQTCAGSPEAAVWEGYGTALKPALEPICLAMKPLDGTFARNALTHGVAGINIDGCRIGADGGTTKGVFKERQPSTGVYGEGINGNVEIVDLGKGRWPANLLLDEGAAAMLDAQSGDRPGGRPVPGETDSRPIWGNAERQAFEGYDDSGGASRFFFVAKPQRSERDLGCEELDLHTPGEMTDREDGSAGLRSPRAGAGRTGGGRNIHSTVKPITLAKYLATLVLPPVQRERVSRILVPFAGSASEMIGAMRAGWDEVHGIEREAEYVAIARARLERWEQVQDYLEPSEVRAQPPGDPRQTRLF